jgi:Family of unknown function (DUF6920)
MKYIFGFLLLMHGIIHLKGFVDAFFSSGINQQVLGISKPVGSFWLITFVLFIISFLQYLSDKNWFYTAFIAVILSQILIIMNWDEAKYGSILNIIIFVVGFVAYGENKFDTKIKAETASIIKTVSESNKFVSFNLKTKLPTIIEKWLENSNVGGYKQSSTVRLKQKGRMRTKIDGKWMPFEAIQTFNLQDPSFVWVTKVKATPFLNLLGRDKLQKGKGEMLIKLASLIPVVNEKSNAKINQGAMLRFLAETCWFPQAALSNYISWKTINDSSAEASFTYNNKTVSGIFKFNKMSDFKSFEGQRYFGGKEDSNLETWYIEAQEYKTFNGIRIPYKNKVTWKLDKKDFHWLTLEVTEIDFN